GFGRYFLGALLAFALVIGGFVALCIGVFVVAGVLVFFYPMLVDRQEMGVGDALGECWSYFKGDWLMAILFSLVTSLISSAGNSIPVIGALITVPISTCIVAAAYDQVFNATAAVPAAAPPAAMPIE
ncbi:hypothetical protein KDL45_19475, partial [bacterium]|nr:hypothetical protein [bacterium]